MIPRVLRFFVLVPLVLCLALPVLAQSSSKDSKGTDKKEKILSDEEIRAIEEAYLEEHPYGRLVLELSPDAMITADSRLDDGIFRLNISQ